MRSEGLDAHRSGRAQHGWQPIDRDAAISALEAEGEALESLLALARDLREGTKGRTITFSPKVFLPVTNLCRDRCAYCTFRQIPTIPAPGPCGPRRSRAWARRGHALGCIEALMCLGDKPEVAFPGYRALLDELRPRSTAATSSGPARSPSTPGCCRTRTPASCRGRDGALAAAQRQPRAHARERFSPRLRERGQRAPLGARQGPVAAPAHAREAGELRSRSPPAS